MDRLALGSVVVGFALILSLVATLLGGFVAHDDLALPAALGALAACACLTGGLFALERRAMRVARPDGRLALLAAG